MAGENLLPLLFLSKEIYSVMFVLRILTLSFLFEEVLHQLATFFF